MASLSQRVRLVRTALDVSQRELASRMRSHVVTLSLIESGRSKGRAKTIEHLAAGLGVEVAVLTDDRKCVEFIANHLGVPIAPASQDEQAMAQVIDGLRVLLKDKP